MEVNIIVQIWFFMDLINPFGVIGYVTWYINMKNPYLIAFGNTKLEYMSATTKIAAK